MINIFVDTSGSMSEMGKDSGTIYVVKAIQDYCDFHNIKNCLYSFDGEAIDMVHKITFDKNIDIEILHKTIINGSYIYNIVITDGLFNNSMKFEKSVAIAIGIDADTYLLEKFFSKLFEAENIIEAVEYLSFLNNEQTDVVEEEDDDEW